jgi:hypothetical protein
MVDTYTPSLRLTEPEISANNDAWAVLLNAGLIGLLDDAIAGEVVVDVTAGNVTLTENDGASDEARAMFIRIIGTPGITRNVITTLAGAVPSKLYIVTNNSDDIVNIGPAPGVALSIAAGQVTMCYADVDSGGMFEVTSDGDYIEEVTGSMGTLVLDILPTPGGGAVTVNAEFYVQGSFVFLTFEEFISTAVAATTFAVLPDSGSWDTIQQLTPQVVKSFPVPLYEDTGGGYLPVDSIITVTSNPTQQWQITRVDGGAYTNPSDRQNLRPVTVFYPLQSNV